MRRSRATVIGIVAITLSSAAALAVPRGIEAQPLKKVTAAVATSSFPVSVIRIEFGQSLLSKSFISTLINFGVRLFI